jgi:hypothetical protein
VQPGKASITCKRSAISSQLSAKTKELSNSKGKMNYFFRWNNWVNLVIKLTADDNLNPAGIDHKVICGRFYLIVLNAK